MNAYLEELKTKAPDKYNSFMLKVLNPVVPKLDEN
jgi:hypothetical protein